MASWYVYEPPGSLVRTPAAAEKAVFIKDAFSWGAFEVMAHVTSLPGWQAVVVVLMVGVAGYYSFLSMMMNTARTAVPADSSVAPLPPRA